MAPRHDKKLKARTPRKPKVPISRAALDDADRLLGLQKYDVARALDRAYMRGVADSMNIVEQSLYGGMEDLAKAINKNLDTALEYLR